MKVAQGMWRGVCKMSLEDMVEKTLEGKEREDLSVKLERSNDADDSEVSTIISKEHARIDRQILNQKFDSVFTPELTSKVPPSSLYSKELDRIALLSPTEHEKFIMDLNEPNAISVKITPFFKVDLEYNGHHRNSKVIPGCYNAMRDALAAKQNIRLKPSPY
uniref:Uncharacterized protein n=1 Tax=Chromera velia CCMP2878 TaxID=1169474 RepID=A0A0G4F0K3_9ALVE|eukprot:Cvel_14442.t1-p1 / transcript=Cvel_14442.t1 / gene=Cvel_14442 / organism=Chromera_velia_CCMP2878 / gene_product=hypothetical protein / transcript_product=hypothetical protein / location=Cvel_scaffold1028:7300-14015(-) / protein_length=161 / sequence_SO=supercontig / SO=protein_coding / is_pseudo=false